MRKHPSDLPAFDEVFMTHLLRGGAGRWCHRRPSL